MNEEQQAAYIQSQVACAMIEMEGMKANNLIRDGAGYSPLYGKDQFLELIERYDIDHTSVIGLFRGT